MSTVTQAKPVKMRKKIGLSEGAKERHAERIEKHAPDRDRLAHNLRYLRTQKKISQRDLAKVAGVSRDTYLRLENGYHDPTAWTIAAIAVALQVSCDDLLLKNMAPFGKIIPRSRKVA